MTTTRSKTALPAVSKLRSTLGMPDMFSRFLGSPYPVLLDSALAGAGSGRFSYFTADPFIVVSSKGRRVRIQGEGGVYEAEGNPFDVVRHLLGEHPSPSLPGLPPFQGGVVGYFGYELGRHLESLPGSAVDDLGMADMAIGLYDWVVSRDHATGETWAVATGLPDLDEGGARSRLRWIEEMAVR